MAQKDIEAIAEQMKAEEAERMACDEAYKRAQEEQQKLEIEEFEELEDEIIDPASVGFIDDSNGQDESDDFYNEDFEETRLNESIEDCLETEPVEEAEGLASIEVDVYNEDGFGEHFASEVMKNVPGVTAKTKKKALPNGDIIVKIDGSRSDLEKAFAFYLGQRSFGALPQEDKEEFESILVFDDGDTLAEADYREAVAHCLDPIGVNASTANLADQDTCAFSMIKEERARRSAKKIIKALNEEDLSQLSDKDLEQLDGIQDALQNGEGADGMTDDELKVWKALLATMGYTPEEWDELSPEEQEKAWKAQDELRGQLSKSGFARWLTGVDPKTGKKFRYQNQYTDFVPFDTKHNTAIDQESGLKAGDTFQDQFNPDYTQDKSRYQHPTTYDREQREAAAKAERDRIAKQREEYAQKALLHSRGKKDSVGKPAITSGDLGRMLSNLSDDEIEELKQSLIEYAKSTAKSAEDAENEVKAIRAMFASAKNAKHKTLADLSDVITGGVSGAPAMKKFVDDFDTAIVVATRQASGKDGSRASFDKLTSTQAGTRKLAKVLSNVLNSRKTGKKPLDPERAMKREEWKKMLKDLGYNPAKWGELSPEEQLELIDQYQAEHMQK